MRINTIALMGAACALLAGCGKSIDAGEVGLTKRFGAIQGETLSAGWAWYNPLSTDIITMNTRALKWQGQKSTSTHDVQQADVVFTVTYQLDPAYAKEVYQRFGREWAARVMPQIIYDVVGNEFGRWDAVRIIEQREKVGRNIFSRVQPRLAGAHIQLLSFDLIKVAYNKAFMDSVEAKQIAIQEAIRQQNHTVEVQEQAKQKVMTAQADAESIKLQTQALTASPAYVNLQAVQKWDGKLPENIYGAAPIPFIGAATSK